MNNTMNNNNGKKLSYERPVVEVMVCKVERGFAGSGCAGVAAEYGGMETFDGEGAIFF